MTRNRQLQAAFLIGALMVAASVVAVAARPSVKRADPGFSLATVVPREFGEWREEAQRQVLVVNPQTQQLLDKLYSEVLSRVYVGPDGYRIMLSVAYGSDQRGALQAHRPEVCYPAQGFLLHSNVPQTLRTSFGEIPARRLFTTLGARQEPVTYWFTVGDRVVEGRLQKRLTEVAFGLTGRIPDGLLFRVSSIDSDQARAFRQQERFIVELLQTVTPAERRRLSGLGGAAMN